MILVSVVCRPAGHKIIIQTLQAIGVQEILIQALQQFTLVGYAKVEQADRPRPSGGFF